MNSAEWNFLEDAHLCVREHVNAGLLIHVLSISSARVRALIRWANLRRFVTSGPVEKKSCLLSEGSASLCITDIESWHDCTQAPAPQRGYHSRRKALVDELVNSNCLIINFRRSEMFWTYYKIINIYNIC